MKYVIAMVTGGIMVTASFLAGGFLGVVLGYDGVCGKENSRIKED